MNTNRTTKSLPTRAAAGGVGFLAAIATIGFAAPAASALPPDGPYLESVAEATPFVPGPGGFELVVPTLPTADVVVDCDATDQVRLEVGNHTTASFLVETHVDDALVDSEWVNPDTAHGLALDFAENDTHEVAVTTGATTLFEEAVALDCLLPAPSYEIIQNCDTLQGHARLVNDGDDTTLPGGSMTDGCESLVGFTPGNIALIDRGACTFVLKSLNAEAAGASAVIIANNVAGATPPGLGGSGPNTLTTVSVTLGGGGVLRAFLGTTVDIGTAASDGSLAGADAAGRPKLYAPLQVAPGSSVSHYDTSAFPNVLMEPFNTNDVDVNGGDVDLTDDLLRDIGWDGDISCPINADSRPTVIVNGCDSGVENRKGEYVVFPSKKWLFPQPGAAAFGAVAGGCYVADLLAACTSPFVAPNHGQYQSCIAQLTKDMMNQGIIGSGEQGAIRSCAAQ